MQYDIQANVARIEWDVHVVLPPPPPRDVDAVFLLGVSGVLDSIRQHLSSHANPEPHGLQIKPPHQCNIHSGPFLPNERAQDCPCKSLRSTDMTGEYSVPHYLTELIWFQVSVGSHGLQEGIQKLLRSAGLKALPLCNQPLVHQRQPPGCAAFSALAACHSLTRSILWSQTDKTDGFFCGHALVH